MFREDYDRWLEQLRESYESHNYSAHEEEVFSLDEVVEEIEEEYNCGLSDLTNIDCEEIVQKYLGIIPVEARYNPLGDYIEYIV